MTRLPLYPAITHRRVADIDRCAQPLVLSPRYLLMLSSEKDYATRVYVKDTENGSVWYSDVTRHDWFADCVPHKKFTCMYSSLTAFQDGMQYACDSRPVHMQNKNGDVPDPSAERDDAVKITAVWTTDLEIGVEALALHIEIPMLRQTAKIRLDRYLPSPVSMSSSPGRQISPRSDLLRYSPKMQVLPDAVPRGYSTPKRPPARFTWNITSPSKG